MEREVVSGHWPIPFGHIPNMTVLLDSLKIALSFVVVGRTVKPADLVNLSVKFTVGSAGIWGQDGIARLSKCPLRFRCTQHPRVCVLSCILCYFAPSPRVPMAFCMILPFPQQVLWLCLQMLLWRGVAREMCSLRTWCASCSRVLWAFPQETGILHVTNPTCQAQSAGDLMSIVRSYLDF